jgi:hypothetical protein
MKRGAPAVMQTWEPHQKSHPIKKMSKSLVRRGEAKKGKFVSPKTTCRETTMLLLVRSRHR